MIKFLLILMLSVIIPSVYGQTLTNGVYVQNGKTIEVDKHIHSFLPMKNSEILYFSNELIVKLNTNSDFNVNSFYQEILNFTNYNKIKFGTHSLSATLSEGSAYVSFSSFDSNSVCAISTSLADLILGNGTFYISVKEEKVIVIVLDGSLKSEASKKHITVTSGYALIITPNDVGILEDKVSLRAEKVNSVALTKLNSEMKDVIDLKGSVLFVNIEGKITGININ